MNESMKRIGRCLALEQFYTETMHTDNSKQPEWLKAYQEAIGSLTSEEYVVFLRSTAVPNLPGVTLR